MSAEIRLVLDAFTQSQSLDQTNARLKIMYELLGDIDKFKDVLGKAVDFAKISKAVSELEKLNARVVKIQQEEEKLAGIKQKNAVAETLAGERVRQEKIKTEAAEARATAAAEKHSRKIKEQTGLIGGLQANIRRLNSMKMQAGTPEQIARINRMLDQQNTKLKTLQHTGKQTTNTFANAASSFQFKFNFLGNLVASGVTTAGMAVQHFVSDAAHSFLEAERNANQLKFSLTEIGDEGQIAFRKLMAQSAELQDEGIFSDDAIQQAQTQLAVLGLTREQIEKTIPQIADMAAAAGIELAPATDKVIAGINGQTRGLKELGIAFKDTGNKTENLAIITEKLTKFQGANAAQLNTTEGKMRRLENAFDDFKETVGEFLVNQATGYLDFWDILSGKVSQTEVFQARATEKFREEYASLTSSVIARNEKIATSQEDLRARTSASILTYSSTIANLWGEVNRANAEGNTVAAASAKARIKALDEELVALRKYHDEIGKTKKIQQDDLTGGDAAKAAEEERKRKLKEANLHRQKLYIEDRNAKKKSDQEKYDFEKQKIKDAQALLDAHYDHRRQLYLEDQQKKKEREEQEYRLRKEALTKQEKLEQEAKEKRFQIIDDTLNKIFAAAESEREERLQQIGDQLSEQDELADSQRRRAENGLENTLAFEERRKAEIKRQEIEERRRLARQKKFESYWNTYASYSKDDPKTALQNTMRDIAIAEAVSAVFAEKGGIGEDITERTTLTPLGLSKSHASGDLLTVMSPKEGILTEKQIENLGGKGAFYDLARMLDNPIKDEVFNRQAETFANLAVVQRNEMNIEPLMEKMDELKSAIKSIPGNTFHVDSFGNLIHTKITQGHKAITNKGSFIKGTPRRKIID